MCEVSSFKPDKQQPWIYWNILKPHCPTHSAFANDHLNVAKGLISKYLQIRMFWTTFRSKLWIHTFQFKILRAWKGIGPEWTFMEIFMIVVLLSWTWQVIADLLFRITLKRWVMAIFIRHICGEWKILFDIGNLKSVLFVITCFCLLFFCRSKPEKQRFWCVC